MKYKILSLAVAALMMCVVQAEEDGEVLHKEKAPARSGVELAKACTACHGETGISISEDFPNIAGQYASYIEHTLRGYRSGERNNAVMQSFVKNLTDQEIKNLANFYAAQSGLETLDNLD